MGIPFTHIRRQGPVLATLGKVALTSLAERLELIRPGQTPTVPTEPLTQVVPARDPRLVQDYISWAGGDPTVWRGRLPPHFFPQWGFPLMARTLERLPYPMTQVLNGGCRFEVLGPIPADRPLHLSATLESIDDDGRRVILEQKLVTRPEGGEDALIARVFAVVPLRAQPSGEPRSKQKPKAKATVPIDAREVAWWRLPSNAGLAFACLTGDFNPIHWLAPYGRMAGFGGTILHGFGTLARLCESLSRVLWAKDPDRLAGIDVRFTRPLRLPAKVGAYIRGNEIYVGDAPGGPAYLTGTCTPRV